VADSDMKTKFFVLISTIDDRIDSLHQLIEPRYELVEYVVSHQVTKPLDDGSLEVIDALKKRSDIHYDVINSKGVAKNRNNALKFLEPGSYAVIVDDDVKWCENALDQIRETVLKNETVDFFTFKIKNADTKGDFKPYEKKERMHSWSSLTGVGTTEMVFKSDIVLEGGVRFDERFGPGAKMYCSGEDYIFATDIYKLGYKMKHIPLFTVEHPPGSTGNRLEEDVIFAKGAVFSRVFGVASFGVDILFAIKKRSLYSKRYSFMRYLKLLWSGSFHFLKNSSGVEA